MRPTLVAEELRRNLTHYLTTTFSLADEATRESLAAFLNDPEQGIFRGPYLRIRPPFRPAGDGWRHHLEWAPRGFTPYQHQAEAFARLSTLHGPAEPTLVTTGTGSGKTESFLVPVLDHCRRARRQGRTGVKAVLLYPMNALANDQAERINRYLEDEPELAGVTAALYIGDTPAVGFSRVLTEREDIRRARPDVLITNYKMLDLLLQRAEDLPLWQDAELAYVVVDEFHTYDGAQGTDVAMLLRRLAAATGHAEPGRPLGPICPVATSATLGHGTGDGEALLRVAGEVFGTPFPPESVIKENRLGVEEFLDEIDYTLPLPNPAELCALPDPVDEPAALEEIAAAVTGRNDLTPSGLGRVLRRHILTAAVLDVLGDGSAEPAEILEKLPRRGAYSWGTALRTQPERAAQALARFVALLSAARDPDAEDRPFLHIEAHVWVRAVSRLLRGVSAEPCFAWADAVPLPSPGAHDEGAGVAAGGSGPLPPSYLPAISCRHCGRSGWAAISPERDPTELVTDANRIYRATVSGDKRRVRALIAATEAEARSLRAEGPASSSWTGPAARPALLSRPGRGPGEA